MTTMKINNSSNHPIKLITVITIRAMGMLTPIIRIVAIMILNTGKTNSSNNYSTTNNANSSGHNFNRHTGSYRVSNL